MSEESNALYLKRYYALHAADDAWSAELQAQFGKNAGDARYTKIGKGEPGTRLRELHDIRMAALALWESGK